MGPFFYSNIMGVCHAGLVFHSSAAGLHAPGDGHDGRQVSICIKHAISERESGQQNLT